MTFKSREEIMATFKFPYKFVLFDDNDQIILGADFWDPNTGVISEAEAMSSALMLGAKAMGIYEIATGESDLIMIKAPPQIETIWQDLLNQRSV